jgi:hypothetical protein
MRGTLRSIPFEYISVKVEEDTHAHSNVFIVDGKTGIGTLVNKYEDNALKIIAKVFNL